MRAPFHFLAVAIGLVVLATGTFAQSTEPDDEEIRNPFEEMKAPQEQPADGSRLHLDEGPAQDSRAASDEIQKNFDDALGNYNTILQGEKSSTIRSLEKRIEQNEKLLEKNHGRLEEYRRATRQAKIEYTRQLKNLENGVRSGRLSEEKFRLEARRLSDEYVFQMNQLEKDIVFYSKETQETAGRLETLREEERFSRIAENKERGSRKKKAPEPSPLEMLATELGGAHQFQMHDIWDDEECRFCRVR